MNDHWADQYYEGYHKNDVPTVLMPNDPNHNATRGELNRWTAEQRRNQGGTFSWTKITYEDMVGLANRMFRVAEVPRIVQTEYWRQ
jgi:hypothetical protein